MKISLWLCFLFNVFVLSIPTARWSLNIVGAILTVYTAALLCASYRQTGGRS